MFQFLENLKAFPVQRVGRGSIPLFPRQGSQISQGAGNAPSVAKFTKNRQALLVQRLGVCGVTLIPFEIPLRVQQTRDAGMISQTLEDGETLRVQGQCASVVALQFDDNGQVTERTS